MPSRHRTAVVGAAPGVDDGLRLPRPPGVLRRFWARHPRFTDVLVALSALVLSLPAIFISGDTPGSPSAAQGWFAGTLIVLGCGALMFRRSHPLVVFAASLVPAVLMPPSIAQAAHLIPVFAIYAVAVYRSVRACWIAFGAAVAVFAAYSAVFWLIAPAELASLVMAFLSAVVSLVIGALIGINVGNRKRYLEALIDRSRQLLVERDQQAQLAAAAERTRIAREMHDIVSHNLTVVVALAEGASATPDPARARVATEQIAATARGALAEMRAMLGVLRAPDAGASAPLTPAQPTSVADAVEAAQRAGFPVVLRTEGRWDDAPAETRFAVVRIVQESLTNAMRHAPLATAIEVRLRASADRIDIDVRNDGVRSAPPEVQARGGFGLIGLRERVAHTGGTIEAGPADGGRWRVHATLPLGRAGSPTTKDPDA